MDINLTSGTSLCVLFINDFDDAIDIINSIIIKFADDIKVAQIVNIGTDSRKKLINCSIKLWIKMYGIRLLFTQNNCNHLFCCYLEYAVATWNLWLQQDIDTLEDVQRRAVRNISGLTGSYEEKLKKIGLTTLQERRIHGDMIQTFKVINQIDDIDPAKFFSMSRETSTHATRQAAIVSEDGTITHSLEINPQHSGLDLRRYIFSNEIFILFSVSNQN